MANEEDSEQLVKLFDTLEIAKQTHYANSRYDDRTTTYPRRLPHHLLRYDYPAFQLVEGLDHVALPEPEGVDFRPRPDATQMQFDQNFSQYRHILNPDPRAVDLSTIVHKCTLEVFEAVEALANQEGKSTISIVRHIDRGSQPAYRVRLNGGLRDMTESSFKELVSINRPWTHLLGDLVFRKSARSYLIAEGRMRAQDIAFCAREIENWRERWMSKDPKNAVQLARQLLRTESGETAQLEDFDNGKCGIMLPCGDVVDISKTSFLTLSEEVALVMTCPDCDQPVLSQGDREEVDMLNKVAAMQDMADEWRLWSGLDGEVEGSGAHLIHLGVLRATLQAALSSFEEPELVAPSMAQPVNCEETRTAFRILQTWLRAQEKVLLISPKDMRLALGIIVMHELHRTCVQQDLRLVPVPRGWLKFLNAWLNRTMNFVTDRRCGNIEHDGAHIHVDDGLLYWTDPLIRIDSPLEELFDTAMMI